MAVLDIRQRTGWLFLAVTVGHLILISTQVNTRRGIPLFEEITFGTFAEVQRGATSLVGRLQDTWQNYFALQEVRRDNTTLRQQVAELQIKLQQERALAAQSRDLQQLLELRSHTQLTTTGASVIGGAASPDFRTMTIDKGSSEGLKPDMAVIAPEGVVGRVILPSRRAAKVQLMIDRSAAAGAMVERTRAQGVVVGTGTNRLQMEYLPGSADVKPGDRVVTSGIDGIYPKGFLLGVVESVKRGAGDAGGVVIKPSVDFGRLESVLVVLSQPPAESESQLAVDGATPPAAAGATEGPKPKLATPVPGAPAPPATADPATAQPQPDKPREDE